MVTFLTLYLVFVTMDDLYEEIYIIPIYMMTDSKWCLFFSVLSVAASLVPKTRVYHHRHSASEVLCGYRRASAEGKKIWRKGNTQYCFDIWCWKLLADSVDALPISFRIASLALGQSCDCPSASEVTMKDMGKTTASKAISTWGHN